MFLPSRPDVNPSPDLLCAILHLLLGSLRRAVPFLDLSLEVQLLLMVKSSFIFLLQQILGSLFFYCFRLFKKFTANSVI